MAYMALYDQALGTSSLTSLPWLSFLAHFTPTTQAFLNMWSLLLSRGLLICFPFACNTLYLDLCMFHFLTLFVSHHISTAQKGLRWLFYLEWQPIYRKRYWIPLISLSLLQKSFVALMDNFLYMQVAFSPKYFHVSVGRLSQNTRVCLARRCDGLEGLEILS